MLDHITLSSMSKELLTYRGRIVTTADLIFIRNMIASNPGESRYALSKRLCRAWDWTQPNGHPKDMICRGLMLHLDREGHIILPPARGNSRQHKRKRPEPTKIDVTPINTSLKKIRSQLRFEQVRRTHHEKIFNSLIEHHHYLGYAQPVGEHLKYIAFLGDSRPIGCLAFSSAAFALNIRDHFIGWTKKSCNNNRHLIAYNTRFLILPWVRVKFLASHLLSKCAAQISSDWQTLYHHPVYWLETFVDTERFSGATYKAANWIFLGKTKGRGKHNKTHKQITSIKDIYGLPLDPRFREKLCL